MATYKKIDLPDGLRPQTLKFVKGVINQFDNDNKLSGLDSMCFYLLAQWLDNFFLCTERIAENGMTVTTPRGITMLSPYATEQKVAQSHINTLLKELGLTLSSRGKIKAVSAVTEDSPLASFIKQSK